MSGTRLKTESETGFFSLSPHTPCGRVRLARFARVRLLRHALPILRKKPDCFAVYFNRGHVNLAPVKNIASEALWRQGGQRKGSLQLRLCNLNICIENVDAKCCLAEATLVMSSLPFALVF